MVNAFIQGLNIGIRQWRIGAIVYVLQLCLAITFGMEVYDVLKASIGHSLEINKLMQHYDHTVITDFLKVHGASITPLIGQLRWLLLVWLLFSVFTNGGLLYCASSPELTSGRLFWQGAAAYFSPFLKITLLFLVLALIWTGIIWLPMLNFLEPSLEYFASEKYTVWLVWLLLLLWLMGLAVLFIWSVNSRLQRFQNGTSIFKNLKSGWQVFYKNKARLMGLLAGFVGLQIILVAVYFLLEGFAGMTSPMLVLVMFLVQQVFIFCRIQIRQMMYAGIACFALDQD